MMIRYADDQRTGYTSTINPALEKSPPPVLAERLGYLLKHAQLGLGAVVEPALAPLGLDGRQYAVLAVLVSEGPRSQQRLSERMRVDRTTMVSLVDDLERKGFVERRRHAADRRAYAIHVTGKGKRALERGRKAVEAAEDELLGPLSPGERRTLKELLLKLV
jgi:DNA-binding MarR family transcriptional regulator